MGLRETLNEKPWMVGAVVAVVVVLAGLVLLRMGGGTGGEVIVQTKAYFSADDGKSYFLDVASRSSPFTTADGKQAIRAHLFRCGGGEPFVGYLEREDGGGNAPAATPSANADATPGGILPGALGGKVIKRPGEKSWTPITTGEGLRIISVKCPDGKDAERVDSPE